MPRLAPRFDVPSTAPIHQSAKRVGAAVSAAQQDAKAIEKDCPQAKALIDSLNAHLFDAQSENGALNGQVDQLDAQLKQQTDRANKLADHSDKSDAALAAASKKLWWYRLHWWGAWIALALGVLACGVFTFLKFTGRLAVVAAKVSL